MHLYHFVKHNIVNFTNFVYISWYMDFFERAKTRSRELGLNIRDVVERSGENYDSYNSMRRYNNLPRADIVVAMAKVLQTTSEFLVTGEDPRNYADEKLHEIRERVEEILRIANG